MPTCKIFRRRSNRFGQHKSKATMDELFSKKFLLGLKQSIIEAALPHFLRIEQEISAKAELSSKEFWSTKELIQRGWMVKQLDELVASGRLARIEAGGSAGFKYPSIQLKQIIDSYGTHTSLAGLPRRK